MNYSVCFAHSSPIRRSECAILVCPPKNPAENDPTSVRFGFIRKPTVASA